MPNDPSSTNPSRWSHRLLVIALALVGCGIAIYLTLYQFHTFPNVFEPFFGDGSRQVLRQSIIEKILPFPDALLGAIAYLVEATLAAIGGSDRFRTHPWIVLAFGAISAALGLAAIGLVLTQAFVVHAWCTLCLSSAIISCVLAILAAPEVIATVTSRDREGAGIVQ